MSKATDEVPDLDIAGAPKRSLRQSDEYDAPEKSGQYVIDSWRVSRPPPGNDFMIDLDQLARVVENKNLDTKARDETPLSAKDPAPRDAVLPPPPSLRTQSIVDPRIAQRTAGDVTASVDERALRASIDAFAGYGEVPQTLLATPSYAVRVLSRRWALQRELASARERSSRDVPVYEAAIESADTDSVQAGILLAVCVAVAVTIIAVAVVAVCF